MKRNAFALLFFLVANLSLAQTLQLQSSLERSGVSGNVWASKGWLLIHARDSSVIEAIDAAGNSTWLEVGPLVQTKRGVLMAARLGDGFIASGLLGTREDGLSLGFLILDGQGGIIENHHLGAIGDPYAPIGQKSGIVVMHAYDLEDGRVAVFWNGFRDPDGPRQQGVSLYDPGTWNRIADVYGPVEMPTHMSGETELRTSFCQVRRAKDTLVIVDAHNGRLALAPVSGSDSAKVVDLVNDVGDRAPVVGWWIASGEDKVYIVYFDKPEGKIKRTLLTFDLSGREIGRRPFETDSTVILPTDTAQALTFSRPGRIERSRFP